MFKLLVKLLHDYEILNSGVLLLSYFTIILLIQLMFLRDPYRILLAVSQLFTLFMMFVIFYYANGFFIFSYPFPSVFILVGLLISQIVIFIKIMKNSKKDPVVLRGKLIVKFKFLTFRHRIRSLLNPILGISRKDKEKRISFLKNGLKDIRKKTNNK